MKAFLSETGGGHRTRRGGDTAKNTAIKREASFLSSVGTHKRAGEITDDRNIDVPRGVCDTILRRRPTRNVSQRLKNRRPLRISCDCKSTESLRSTDRNNQRGLSTRLTSDFAISAVPISISISISHNAVS